MKSFYGSAISSLLYFIAFFLFPAAVLCISSSDLTKYPDVLKLSSTFDPIIAAYWTGLPHHRRTPFSVSPDGKSAYLAYLDTTYNSVFVQQVDPGAFVAVGDAVKISGAREAGGLVAQNDGFALLTTVIPSAGTADDPPNGYPIAEIIRYQNGKQAWATAVNGPGVHEVDGLSATPDINGDLVYSEAAGLYAAYFVVTAYTGDASGHFGDSIQYVDDSGALQTIAGASSTWGCSHNTGIALEAADAAPFASVCAEDHGAIWLNTNTQSMNGVKIANENTTNGVSGEPLGGMGGSYSSLALFPETSQYIFAWQSRGALNLKADDWMGAGFTTCDPRWLNHNVAITITKDKSTLVGEQAISEVGAASGDAQVNWITESDNTDHQNVRVATFDSGNALVTWEELTAPNCQPVPLGCTGTFSGTFFQQVDSTGKRVGDAFSASDVLVAGDIANVGDKLCWPYVNMKWDLSAPKANGTYVSSISFACVSLGGSEGGDSSTSSITSIVAPTSAPSSASATLVVEDEATDNSTTIVSASDIGPSLGPMSTASFQFITTADSVAEPTASSISSSSTEVATPIATLTASVSPITSSPSDVTSDALPTRTFVNIATISDTATVTSTDAETTTEVATSIDATSTEITTTISSVDITASSSSAAITFTNILTLPTNVIITMTETPASTNEITSTEAATSTDAATSIEITTSAIASNIDPTSSATRTFTNILTLPTDFTTATENPTSTEASTPADTATSTEATISTITSSADLASPTASATRSFFNIISLTTTIAATEIAPSPTQSDSPTSTVGTWGSCADGTVCAPGHRCIAFRGGVSVCVPTKNGSRGHHGH